MRRYFMTGCTGWLGKPLVQALARREDTEQIILLTRDPQRNYAFYGISPKVQLYEGDILRTPFPTGYFTNVIHGANEPLGSDPGHNYYVMVEGTRRLLKWATENTIRPYIMLLSSGGVTRDTPYGHGKLMTEFLLNAHTVLGKVARIYTLVGPKTPIRYAIGQFIREAIDYGRVSVVGGKNVFRSYLNVEDAAAQIIDIIDHGEILRPVDVGSSECISVYDAAKLVAEVFGATFAHVDAPSGLDDKYLPAAVGRTETLTLRQSLEKIRDEAGIRMPNVEQAEAA